MDSRLNRAQFFLLALVLVLPLIPVGREILPSLNQAAVYVVVAASLVMLVGWVGQISLGHAALVGVGAYGTGWAMAVLGVPFPLNIPVAAAVAAGFAALLGAVALRVRGLYLAVATLIFSWAASEFLFRQDFVTSYGSMDNFTIGSPGTLLHFNFSGSRVAFFYLAWGIALAALYALSNLRDSKTGRAFFAVRGSEMAASSLGMNVLKYKVLAFALSGGLAGIAGNLIMTEARVVTADAFDFSASLFYLAIVVVGGLASLPGAVAAGLFFAMLGELFFRVEFLGDYLQIVSALLLAVVFRLYPGGLAALARAGLERLEAPPAPAPSAGEAEGEAAGGSRLPGPLGTAERSLRRLGAAAAKPVLRRRSVPSAAPTADLLSFGGGAGGAEPVAADGAGGQAGDEHAAVPGEPEHAGNGSRGNGAPDVGELRLSNLREYAEMIGFEPPDPARRSERAMVLEAANITVRFGGLVAVKDASINVRSGEIVGLIGPNGAGKTTLFNSIAGFNSPTTGRVHVYGVDVTDLEIHERARLGVARTFQRIQLFPQLTVFDNLLAATHLQNTTGFVQHVAVTRQAYAAESTARGRVTKVVKMLELEDVADRYVAALPFGVLRMVEVARALVTGSRFVMLDEPASGLDEAETDRLSDVLAFVRTLGATLLLIEHDVRMVTGVSDYMFVINQGEIIAEGAPADIQSNEDVIAAYLGQSTQSQHESEPAGVS